VSERVPVIAIGSSADGLPVLRELVGGLPADLPAAVILVQHLSPRRPSGLARLLARYATIRVTQAADGVALMPGTVYVAQPGRHVTVWDGTVRLGDGPRVQYSRPSIDVLFSSVARACGARSVGVLLGGAGSDGAEGLSEIRKAGGATVVQDPEEARFPRMPQQAVARNGHHVMRLADIPAELARLADAFAEDGATTKGDAR
jgi:two-component system chemotaxis response regulator CheB